MKIVVDENIIYAEQFFAQGLDVPNLTLIKKAGRDICHADLLDADVLLVRSVTQVNESLLKNTSVKFVGTATIGTDHIDVAYLHSQSIYFADAAGCSAHTVAQYVLHAIYTLRPHYFTDSYVQNIQSVNLGIVGYGNIGKVLADYALWFGWKIWVYDPFVNVETVNVETKLSQNNIQQVDFETMLKKANIMSLHVPLTEKEESTHPTYHLINQQVLELLPASTLLINTARGKVVCEQDLLEDIQQKGREVVLDVFEHEPLLSSQLLDALALATPHIAGYSLEGKARGTQFIYNSLCDWLQVSQHLDYQHLLPPVEQLFTKTATSVVDLTNEFETMYAMDSDSLLLQKTVKHSELDGKETLIHNFDKLRKQYLLRREWQAYGL